MNDPLTHMESYANSQLPKSGMPIIQHPENPANSYKFLSAPRKNRTYIANHNPSISGNSHNGTVF
jgi:hypothetical protein